MDHGKERCFGNGPGKEFYAAYHDNEWGVACHDDVKLFEMLILEGAQAGLSWETVLKKRDGYRRAFHNFEPAAVAVMSDEELDLLCHDPAIIRNKRKIYAARQNGRIFLEIQREHGSFDMYLWSFVGHLPIVNRYSQLSDIPNRSVEADRLSKSLQRYGMTFVGPTIIYAYMQAVGLVNDHITSCWCAHKS